MATIAYLDIDQGSDFSAEIQLENDDGTPMDLSGFEVYSQFRKSYGSVIGYSFTCTVLDASNGVILLNFLGIDSSNIRPGRFLYDIEIFNTILERKTRVLEGIVTINAEITKIP
jgi:hypothetical protein